jgi:hypothetical protein
MALGFNKMNFWPRPKDQMHDTLLRTVVQLPGISFVSAMAVFDDKLYVAGQHPAGPNAPPVLYEWDEVAGTLTQITLPAAVTAVATNTQITGMVVFNNLLWIVTGASATAADNGLMFALDTGGTWTNATALGFPGWTGAAVVGMIPRLFIYGGQFVAAARPGVGTLELHYYNATAWTLEATALGSDISSTQQIETADGSLYFTRGNRVQQRTPTGVYNTAILLDGLGGPVIGGLAQVNGEVWAAQAGPGAGLISPPMLSQVTPAASQKIRALRTGITAMAPTSAALDVQRNEEVLIAATADPGSDVLLPGSYPAEPISELVIIEDGLSLRPLVNIKGTASFIVPYRQYLYVAHGAPYVATLPASTLFTAQLSVIE